MNKNINDIPEKELTELYDMVQDELGKMLKIIEKKSGYFTEGTFSLLADTVNKSFEVDMLLSMLEAPHAESESKIRHYVKQNPNNVMNKPIFAYKHNSWYMIYDGVHRFNGNSRIGKKTIKTNIIIPSPNK